VPPSGLKASKSASKRDLFLVGCIASAAGAAAAAGPGSSAGAAHGVLALGTFIDSFLLAFLTIVKKRTELLERYRIYLKQC
jgi:hypothetical protein